MYVKNPQHAAHISNRTHNRHTTTYMNTPRVDHLGSSMPQSKHAAKTRLHEALHTHRCKNVHIDTPRVDHFGGQASRRQVSAQRVKQRSILLSTT